MFALTLTGIPVSMGANEAVHQPRLLDEEAETVKRRQEFQLDVFCGGKSRKREQVHGATVVLEKGKVRLCSPQEREPGKDVSPCTPPHPFTGFYLPFPAHDLPQPHAPMPTAPMLGLVTTVPHVSCASGLELAKPKPKLNWVYVDRRTRELRYGTRVEAKKHVVGPWDWTEDEVGVVPGRRMLRCSLERRVMR